jgi:DnaJ domain/Protein of unknown function (DUF1232)
LKIIFTILALLYAVFPRDLIPDYLIGWGWIDDLVVFYLLWKYFYAPLSRGRKETRSRRKAEPQGETPSSRDAAAGNPYAVLGVDPDATPEQIRQAYRSLAAQYHPDKVAHLGEEFRALAEQRFKEIQDAYEKIRPKRSQGTRSAAFPGT